MSELKPHSFRFDPETAQLLNRTAEKIGCTKTAFVTAAIRTQARLHEQTLWLASKLYPQESDHG